MSKRESFLIRIDPMILQALKNWAEAELRSTNSHVEYLLRESLIRAGRLSDKAISEPPGRPEPPGCD